MSLTIRVDLLHGRYDAGARDARVGEWPPHPARFHCALLAGVRDEEEVAALEWLERQAPPLVLVDPEILDERVHVNYTVTNSRAAKGGHQTYPGREAQERVRTSVLPGTPSAALRWPDADPEQSTLAALQRLARRVPYLGRSTSAVVVDIDSCERPDRRWRVLAPVPAADTAWAHHVLRVAYPGYTSALADLHEAGARAWEADRERGYRDVSEPTAEDRTLKVAPSPHEHLVVLELPPGTHVPGPHVGRLTNAARAALLKAASQPVPASVSGHGADGETHVAFLPLMDVGHGYAQGHAIGVGIAVPRDDAEAQAAVARAVERGLELDLHVTRMRLTVGSRTRQSRRLSPAFWRGPARMWSTATPVVLDRFPKRGVDAEVADMCERLGLPRPTTVMTSPSPLRAGVPRIGRLQLPRVEQPPRPFVHAHLVFDRPVAGPLVLGRQRYLGMGLCFPDRWQADRAFPAGDTWEDVDAEQ